MTSLVINMKHNDHYDVQSVTHHHRLFKVPRPDYDKLIYIYI